MTSGPPAPARARGSRIDVFLTALRLGLTSFGGAVAHLGYFRHEYVERRGWLTEAAYADLVALCQVLPGPASSQLGIAIGTMRAGRIGGLLAWLGFTLPSAVVMTVLALIATASDLGGAGWVHGLKVAAVAVVASAVVAMWRSLAPDLPRSVIALCAAAVALALPSPWTQIAIIVVGAMIGRALLPTAGPRPGDAEAPSPYGRRFAVACLAVFAVLLVGLPLVRAAFPGQTLAVIDAFYRTGAIVFGGGHVVLPLLHETVVTPGWVSDGAFLAGYGAVQAVPGPLFTFAAYLGAIEGPTPNGVPGAAVALVAIFLPSFLLIWGALPFWHRMRRSPALLRALRGTNAAVVGLLLAALVTPVWTGAIERPADVLVAGAGFTLLLTGRVQPLLVVLASAATGEVIARLG